MFRVAKCLCDPKMRHPVDHVKTTPMDNLPLYPSLPLHIIHTARVIDSFAGLFSMPIMNRLNLERLRGFGTARTLRPGLCASNKLSISDSYSLLRGARLCRHFNCWAGIPTKDNCSICKRQSSQLTWVFRLFLLNSMV